jgi:hypothetical protein
METLLRRRPRADCQRARNIWTVNITGRSLESSGKLHGNVASHTRGESCFTLPQITSEGVITSTAGRTNGWHGVVWKERLAAARNAAAGAVRAPAPGMTNVVRFPLEHRTRPTLELQRGVTPDVREVLNIAEALGMAMPVPDLRERVDAATAEHIANQIPASGAAREAMLCKLLEPVVAGAIASCREAHDAWAGAAAAEETRKARSGAGATPQDARGRAWRGPTLSAAAGARAKTARIPRGDGGSAMRRFISVGLATMDRDGHWLLTSKRQ